MELSASLLSAITKPAFLLREPNFTSSITHSDDQSSRNKSESSIDLCNRSSQWRIDGSNMLGRQLYAVPMNVDDLVPTRIDVYLPDQLKTPGHLRVALESSASVVLRNGADVDNLKISQHICRALDSHCRQNPGFWNDYRRLPFGSCMVFDKIDPDPEEMELKIQPTYDLERQTLSLPKLKQLWGEGISEEAWPATIDISHLRLVRQLHDSVSVVRMLGHDDEEYVFKSSVSDVRLVYHELAFLLRCPPHPNIVGKPLHIVTKKSAFGGKNGVYGFILPYYARGSLRDHLPACRLSGELSFERQWKWSKQVCSALMHITTEAQTFYSDLRPDNILLTEGDDLVLIDFEQRGNWYEWCAPEIKYQMYVNSLQEASAVENTNCPTPRCVGKLLETFEEFGSRSSALRPLLDGIQTPAMTIRNKSWIDLTHGAQKRAMVYSLGLLLFCIFEGTCNPTVSLTNAWPIDPDTQFPDFVRTPDEVQTLIKQCTVDAPEWRNHEAKGVRRFTRDRDRVVIVGNDSTREPEISAEIAKAWQEEVEMATAFFAGERWLLGHTGAERPSLREVLEQLEAMESTHGSD